MDPSAEPDWIAAEAALVREGQMAIDRFSACHAGEICSFFAFCVDYSYGDVVICFDTIDNSLLHAKRYEAQTLKAWRIAFRDEKGWENVRYHIAKKGLCSHNPHTGEFQYPAFSTLQFADWDGFFGSERLPTHPDPVGHVIVLMHKVIDELVNRQCFDRLSISSPFRVGVEFSEDELGLVVMRLLNWPPHKGPRV